MNTSKRFLGDDFSEDEGILWVSQQHEFVSLAI